MATFTGTGGGDLLLAVTKTAHASCATEINDVELGAGLLGPQPFADTGGGDLDAEGSYVTPPGVLYVYGGGNPVAAGTRRALPAFTLTGGGQPTGTGDNPRANAVEIPCTVLHLLTLAPQLGQAPPPPIPGLELAITSGDLPLSPGPITVTLANGTPGADVTFTLAGLGDVAEAVFDDTGTIHAAQIPISVPAAGTYGLTATDAVTSATATADVTVDAISTPQTIGVPVTTPPPAVQPAIGVKKWVFQDPVTDEVYHFAINPNRMTSPFTPKRVTFAATTAIDGQSLVFEGQPNPVEWQFEGALITKAQYDELLRWKNKHNRIWITDHRGRAWLCYLTNFAPQDRRSTNHPWSHDYTMSALIFEGPTTPVEVGP